MITIVTVVTTVNARMNNMNNEYDFTPYYRMDQITKFLDGFIGYDEEQQRACFYRVRTELANNRHEDWARAFLGIQNVNQDHQTYEEGNVGVNTLLKNGYILYSRKMIESDQLEGILFPGQYGFSGDLHLLEPDQIRMFLELCEHEKRVIPEAIKKELNKIRFQKIEENSKKYYGY